MIPDDPAGEARETLKAANVEIAKASRVLRMAKLPCPHCGCWHSRVTNSRPGVHGGGVWRRRQCVSCRKRFTTEEVIIGKYRQSA